MNTKPTNFDINRHVLGIVDDEKKIVTIVLTCELHRAEEMFMKVVRSIAASYKGYEIVAPLFSINDKLNFALYANPIWKDTNDALLRKRVSFFTHTARTRYFCCFL